MPLPLAARGFALPAPRALLETRWPGEAEPVGATRTWLRLAPRDPVTGKTGAPVLEPPRNAPFGRAPAGAAPGVGDEALPKGA
jgi:hypothetical protein